MYCIVQFRMLLFILTYVLYIVNVSCNNDTLKAEINPSAGKWSTSLNISNTNVMLGEVKHSENKTKQVFFGEGGSMSPAFTDKNYDSSTSKTSIQNETLNEKILQYEIPFGLNDSSISSDHKPHIGRKGVDATKETSLEETPVEQNSNEPTKTIELGQKSVATNVSNLTSSTIRPNNLTSNFTINSTNANGTTRASTSSQGNLNQSTSSSTMLTNFPVSRNGIQNSSSENTLNVSELTPPKPKPEFTRDDSDVDDNSYSLTNPENDYVIPVVATIFAAPLLIVLAMFLYKRSKEFWERRHYRRMDFLIDGMYND